MTFGTIHLYVRAKIRFHNALYKRLSNCVICGSGIVVAYGICLFTGA